MVESPSKPNNTMVPMPTTNAVVSTQNQQDHNQNFIYRIPVTFDVGSLYQALSAIAPAGLSEANAQKLNYHWLNGLSEAEIDRIKRENELTYLAMKQSIEHPPALPQQTFPIIPANPNNNFITSTPMPTGLEHINNFIFDNILVKVKKPSTQKVEIMMKDENYPRHIWIQESKLKLKFFNYIKARLPDNITLSANECTNAWNTCLDRIPSLQQAMDGGLRCMQEYEVVFLNGYFDLRSVCFKEFDNKRFFNRHVLPFEFYYTDEIPQVFEKLQNLIANGNEARVKLSYQTLGMVLSSVTSMKTIILFQGVSGSGKTRTSELYELLVNLDDSQVIKINDISAITENFIQKIPASCRLLIINDSSGKKISDKQAVALQAFANGSHSKDASPLKIVINTNFSVFTGKNGFLHNPLRRRLLLNPFAYSIDECNDPEILEFENTYLNSEIMLIINKALREFAPIYNDPMHIWANAGYEINDCVETESHEINKDTLNSSGYDLDKILELFINAMYEFSFEINPEVRADTIFQDLNKYFPGLVSNTAWLGRKLTAIFGEKLRSQHTSRGIEYNLVKK